MVVEKNHLQEKQKQKMRRVPGDAEFSAKNQVCVVKKGGRLRTYLYEFIYFYLFIYLFIFIFIFFF